jgi:tetrahydromethanopterin S-methyltransferase subunit G
MKTLKKLMFNLLASPGLGMSYLIGKIIFMDEEKTSFVKAWEDFQRIYKKTTLLLGVLTWIIIALIFLFINSL